VWIWIVFAILCLLAAGIGMEAERVIHVTSH
jgi:hypothetical protein